MVSLTGTGSAPEASVSPPTVAFGSQIVGSTSGVESVAVLNTGNANLTIALVTISEGDTGDFAIEPTGTTCVANGMLRAGSSCAVNLAFTPTAGGSRSATLTISDNSNNQGATIQNVALSGTGEDFALAVAPGTSSSAAVSPGQAASYSVSISPLGGFNQTVTFACAGGPSQSTCSVTPSSVLVNGSSTSTATVTVTTAAAAVAVDHWENSGGRGPAALLALAATYPVSAFLGLVTLIAALLCSCRREINPLLRRSTLAAILACSAMLVSCGGGGGTSPPANPGTPAGAYTLLITGTSGNLSHSTTLMLTVN